MVKPLFLTALLIFFVHDVHSLDDSSKEHAQKIADAHGGKKAFYHLRDVSFDLEVKNLRKNTYSKSHEIYLFDGEISRGHYFDSSSPLFAPLIPFFELLAEESFYYHSNHKKSSAKSDFRHEEARRRRKENYYLLALPFKLSDEGIQMVRIREPLISKKDPLIRFSVLSLDPKTSAIPTPSFDLWVDAKSYQIKKLLYQSQESSPSSYRLVLFQNSDIHGLWISTRRDFYPSDSKGNTIGPLEEQQELTKIRFWNGWNLRQLRDFNPVFALDEK